MRVLSSSLGFVDGYTAQGNCSERTRRVIGHRVAILEHAEMDGDSERGTARVWSRWSEIEETGRWKVRTDGESEEERERGQETKA